MSPLAGVIVVSMGIMAAIGATVAAFGHARRKPALYLFALTCSGGVLYGAATVSLLDPDLPNWMVVGAAQLGYLSASLYIASNILFLSRYSGLALARWERVLGVWLPALVTLAVCVPGLCYETERVRHYEVLGTPHLSTIPTPFAYVTVCAVALALGTLLRMAFRLRRTFFQRASMIAALALLVVLGACDMLVTLALVELPYLASTGGVAVSLAMTAHLASQWGEETRQLDSLRRSLEQGIERRSEQLRDAHFRLAHKDRLEILGSIAAAVGHEVNNPLTYVITNLAILAEEELDEETHELVVESLEGARRIARIVRDLREVIDPPQRRRPVDIEAALQAAKRTLRHRTSSNHSISIRVPTAATVLADHTQLTQIFINLFGNALDSFDADATHGVEATVETTDSEVVVRVTNDGPPIDTSIRSDAFEPFHGSKPDGLGLGLSIVRDLVHGFDGHVRLDDDRSRTTFIVELPRCEPRPEVGDTLTPGQLRGLRILLIDDEPEVGAALARMMSPATVKRVLNGFAALEELERHAFDLVLCDVMMPELTGIDLHRTLKERGEIPDSFIFMTGGAPNAEVDADLRATGVPVLYKPFELAELLALIDAPDEVITPALATDRGAHDAG